MTSPSSNCPHCYHNPPAIEPLFVSRKDAAAALAISLRGVAYLIAQGELKVRKIGGRTVIPITELRRFARQDHRRRVVPPETREITG